MPARHWMGFMLAMTPLAALGAGPAGVESPPAAEAMDAEFLEFLAEEAGLDDELSEALMSNELDREIERPAERQEVQGNAKNQG